MNRSKKRLKGKMVEPPHPLNWKPLVELAGKQAEDFMLMFDVELKNGPRLTAFKHWLTRGYIHLSRDGRAFVFEHDGRHSRNRAGIERSTPSCTSTGFSPHGEELAEYREPQ